jgi:hypothetical protein
MVAAEISKMKGLSAGSTALCKSAIVAPTVHSINSIQHQRIDISIRLGTDGSQAIEQ